MARGRFVGRIELVLGLVWVVTVAVAYVLITGSNPLPGVLSALGRIGDLSRPEVAWHHDLGDPPRAAVAAGDAVVIFSRDAVETRDLGTGGRVWHRPAAWSALAGDGTDQVVLVGARGGGMEAVPPGRDAPRWRDPDAVAAWAFRTAVITLSCQRQGGCALALRAPGDQTPRWRSQVPGLGRGFTGANRGLVQLRNPSTRYAAAADALPAPLPPVLGITVGRRVEMIDTASGRLAMSVTPPTSVQVAVAAGRLITTTASEHGGECRHAIEATVPAGGAVAWHRDGPDAHTVTGAGCGQHRAPTGGGSVLAVTGSDGRQALLSAADGRQLWTGAPGESVRAVGEKIAVIGTAGGERAVAVDQTTGGQRWSQPLPERSGVTVLRYAVLLLDEPTGRLRAYDPETGRSLLDARILGEVIGAGPQGLVLARGRTFGFVRWQP